MSGRLLGPLLVGAWLLATIASPAAAACPPTPSEGCKVAGGAKISLRNVQKEHKDQLLWRWGRGEVLPQSDFGDPINGTSYRLCMYAGTAQALVYDLPLPAGAGWSDLDSGGYGFSAPNADGVRFVSLKPGQAGKTNAAVKGKGVSLPDPDMPLPLPLTAQLLADPQPLCLQTVFATPAVNTGTRFKAQAEAILPSPPGTIPGDDTCNKAGDDGSIADQIGAQMRRSGTEWASTCIEHFGSGGSVCNVDFPGDSTFLSVPDGVPSLTCPNTAACDYSLGRVEWHAEDKFPRRCTLDQWALVWSWIQQRAGTAAPPDCDMAAFAPRFWGVYACFERHYVWPLLLDQHAKLRDYASPNPPMTNACEAAVITRMWWRLASDWIRFGNDTCKDGFHDSEVRAACAQGGVLKFDQDTWNGWCDDFTTALRPVYEGVRAASGKPY